MFIRTVITIASHFIQSNVVIVVGTIVAGTGVPEVVATAVITAM